jgi:hypothetical protein
MRERKDVTRKTTRRYRRANRRAKTLILNELMKVTKLNRKYTIRLLNGTLRSPPPHRGAEPRGRPALDDHGILAVLKRL